MTAAATQRKPRQRKPKPEQEPKPEQQSAPEAPNESAEESGSAHSAEHPASIGELDDIQSEIFGPGGSGVAANKSAQGEGEPQDAGWSAIQSGAILRMGFAAIAAGRGAHWALGEEESDMLGGSLDRVLDKYFPDGPGRFGPEIALFSSLMVVIAPRLSTDAQIAVAQQKAKAEAEAEKEESAEAGADAVGMD